MISGAKSFEGTAVWQASKTFCRVVHPNNLPASSLQVRGCGLWIYKFGLLDFGDVEGSDGWIVATTAAGTACRMYPFIQLLSFRNPTTGLELKVSGLGPESRHV